MRKHDVRKWLHAILDLLPVILIPVFMIYSHRHDVTENVQVNYKYQSNEVNTVDDLIIGNIYELNINNSSIDDYFLAGIDYLKLEVISVLDYNFSNYNFSIGDTVTNISNSEYENVKLILEIADDAIGYFDLYFSPLDSDYIIDTLIGTLTDEPFTFKCIGKIIDGNFAQSEYEIFSYTDYNVIESVDIENTNVMDSFMNNFNNTIAQHFNMGNVFNLNGVYQWFNTNIFSGHAPTVIYSIWNIALYELVMDLLFLLYGLFMWFIDMIQKLMEKPLNSVR